jgi:uncharacterized protein with PQ loop repeat
VSLVLSILVAVATVMGAGMIVPQVVRLHRTGLVDGLSGAWVGLSLAMNGWWIAYASAEELWGLLPVSVAAFALYAVIAVQYARVVGWDGARRLVTGLVPAAVLPGVALLTGGWTTTGLAIGLAYAVQFSPALVAALRAADLGGISPATWTMAWVEAVIWCAYGAVMGDLALMIGGGGGTVMASVILARLWTTARPALRLAA